MDTEFAMRDENNNVKALFRQGQVLKRFIVRPSSIIQAFSTAIMYFS